MGEGRALGCANGLLRWFLSQFCKEGRDGLDNKGEWGNKTQQEKEELSEGEK